MNNYVKIDRLLEKYFDITNRALKKAKIRGAVSLVVARTLAAIAVDLLSKGLH